MSHFFISRAGEDSEWAKWIANTLEDAGHSTTLQDFDFKPGHVIPHQMKLALEKADHIIAILSPQYLFKDFTLSELYVAFFADPLGRRRRVIPIRVAPIDGSPLFAPIVYIDFVDQDQATCKQRLLDGIRSERIVQRVPFPRDTTSCIPAAASHRAFISKLPTVNPILIGRESELAILDGTWEAPSANFLQIIAAGGTGKTALVDKWFRRHLGEATFFGWSFYSQGASQDRQTSSDSFFAEIISWLQIDIAPTASVYAKAEAIADVFRHRRILLFLDGVEPLQDPSGTLRDSALKALLQELAASNLGLVVCTTRFRMDIPDDTPHAQSLDLDNLTPEQGAEYLIALKVLGSQSELRDASREYWNHALALTLLGTYVTDFCDADIRRRIEIPKLVEAGSHASRIIAAYEKIFQDKPDAAVLRGLGYFDRPAEPAALKLVVPEMTSHEYRSALIRLHRARLIVTRDPSEDVDCHPLVREYFASYASMDGHARLYDHYRKGSCYEPDTLHALTPLFYAVYHGCRAGRYNPVFTEVYFSRIIRKNEFYLTRKLGSFGINLSLLANFFATPWTRPFDTLSRPYQSWVVNAAGFALRALGRLAEAAEPTQAAAELAVEQKDWINAAIGYRNLSELHLALGQLSAAVTAAGEAMRHCGRSADSAAMATAVHQLGDLKKAGRLFKEAEILLVEATRRDDVLSSIEGYRYADFLLEERRTAEVIRRSSEQLNHLSGANGSSVLDRAWIHLALGRAYAATGSHEAASHLDQAVELTRRAGTLHHLPHALLARGRPTDLDEAFRIASRSGMRLILADYYLAVGNIEEAGRLIHETGYHRRDRWISEAWRRREAGLPPENPYAIFPA